MLLFNQKVIKFSALIIGMILASGCMQITSPLNAVSLLSVKQKATIVFLRQNSALNQVIMLTIEDENEAGELLLAEQQVREACTAINAYANGIILGETPGLFAQQRVLNSLDACEHATQILEALLQQYQGF